MASIPGQVPGILGERKADDGNIVEEMRVGVITQTSSRTAIRKHELKDCITLFKSGAGSTIHREHGWRCKLSFGSANDQ